MLSLLDKQYLTVTQFHESLNSLFEKAFPQAFLRGELSEVKLWKGGHIYCTLKDERSTLSLVMWASTAARLTFAPKVGDEVMIAGRPNVYAASGRFQFVVHAMMHAGAGALQQRFNELKQKLEREGLFNLARKRALPWFPKAVGLVTSASGAVRHDMMVKFQERMPSLRVYLIDVRVQGEGAAREIADAIAQFNQLQNIEVLIVARGGGSLEDLWAFNEEVVVRAIFASAIPVVSAVGHEVDFTLADFAADVRAPTPTAAAVLVVPDRKELLEGLADLESRLRTTDRWFMPLVQRVDEFALRLESLAGKIQTEARLRLQAAQSRLQTLEPRRLLEQLRGRVALWAERLLGAGRRAEQVRLRKFDSLLSRLQTAPLPMQFARAEQSLIQAQSRLNTAYSLMVQKNALSLSNLEARLYGISPEAVLSRGYALIEREELPIGSVTNVVVGDELSIRMKDGRVTTTVTSVAPLPSGNESK